MGELVPLIESYGVNVRMNKPTTVIKNVYTTSIGVNGGEYKLDAFKNNNLGESMQVLVGTGINETPEWQDIQLPLPTGNTRKRTGIDAGVLNERSVTDDYEYICIQGGEVGVAIWKKQPLSVS